MVRAPMHGVELDTTVDICKASADLEHPLEVAGIVFWACLPVVEGKCHHEILLSQIVCLFCTDCLGYRCEVWIFPICQMLQFYQGKNTH